MNDGFFDISLDTKQHAKTDEFSFILKPSGIKGVGVFATHGISQGTHLALFPNGATRTFSREQLENDPCLKSFCQVYGVESGNETHVAQNFGYMSIGWYLNHSETPNAQRDANWEYFASHDIAADEEITIDYRAL